ncbi:MAG: DUF4190 domain-containing protein [Bacteroidetes bacterium]|nr:MAG: DUF4190 domain-containing protein [Bacteroidota bacterium]
MENVKKPLPNATATLVLGICSIVFGCFFVGLVLGIIGLAISGKSRTMYMQNPGEYEGYGSLNAGRILSIIGIVLGSLTTIYYVVIVMIIGAATLPWHDLLNY